MKRLRVTLEYLKLWFWLDLLASFPYEMIFNINSDPDAAVPDLKLLQLSRLLKIARFLRVLRLLRVLKLKRLIYRFEEFFFNDSVSIFIDVMKLFTIIFFIAHWIGCFFFAVSNIQIYSDSLNWITINGK